MMTLCKTSRGRIACGLGGVLVAFLALACLWGFSPSVTAGDDTPGKSAKASEGLPPPPPAGSKACPPALPPGEDLSVAGRSAAGPDVPPKLPAATPAPPEPPLPKPTGAVPPPAEDTPLPPMPPPAADTVVGKPSPTPPLATTPPPPPAPSSAPSSEGQEIKQLVAQLSAIRSERATLDERERQTIQSIKRKFQDQKRALEQLERELRQLGISWEESAPDREPIPPAAVPTKPR